MLYHLRSLFLLIALSFFPESGQASDLPDLGEASRARLSPQLERRIGESIMNQIRLHEPSYVNDQEIGDYLNQLGRRLVEASSNSGDSFHFFAIADNTINAFAMFGGFIGINTGTMLAAQSESELAAVVAHEIAHVTQNHFARQMDKQHQNTMHGLIAMAVGILAARANSSAAGAIIASSQAGMVQAQLAYSREFEREADRIGFQFLERAGFDVRGKSDFFERLHRATHLHDSSAPVYLRTHPLTLERISDMQNRAQLVPYRQVVSSPDFFLTRAKIRAFRGIPREAVNEFDSQLREKKFTSLAATRYGLVVALMRAEDFLRAQKEMEKLLALRVASPMISGLEAELRRVSGDTPGALNIYREAMHRFPQSKALVYSYAELLHQGGRFNEALRFTDQHLQRMSSDYRLHAIQAKTHAVMGNSLQQHRSRAEYFAARGQIGPAIEQLLFAQQSTDGNFYEQSKVDARLRQLKSLQRENERIQRAGR